jgi:hypothetical protein
MPAPYQGIFLERPTEAIHLPWWEKAAEGWVLREVLQRGVRMNPPRSRFLPPRGERGPDSGTCRGALMPMHMRSGEFCQDVLGRAGHCANVVPLGERRLS